MSTFTLATSYLTTSKLPWFMDLTFQIPMHYQRAQTKACVHQNPGTPCWARPAFVCLSVSCGGGIGRQWPAMWTGLWLQQTWEGWCMSPSTELQSRQPRNWKPQTKPCAHQDPGERSIDSPQETEPNLPVSVQESPAEAWVNSGCCGVRSTEHYSHGISPFEVGHHYLYLFHSLALGQTIRREHSPTLQQKIGLKIYWAWPHLSEQDPDSATASPSHREASTSLLSLLIKRHTECIPQSHKTNQTDHMDHRLV